MSAHLLTGEVNFRILHIVCDLKFVILTLQWQIKGSLCVIFWGHWFVQECFAKVKLSTWILEST